MSNTPIKYILRNAVIAALPVALQAGCMTTTPQNPPKPPMNDPCRGPVERNDGAVSGAYTHVSSIGSKPLSKEECTQMCLIETKKQLGHPRNAWRGIIGAENMQVNRCATTPTANDQVLLDCRITYTELTSTYTGAPGCPTPPPPLPVVGRIPAGAYIQEQPDKTSVLGMYFSNMAAMETAAVTAFRYLTRELEAYQAPDELVRMARAAIDEEIDHAEMAGLLSQAYATPVPEVRVDDFQLRSLFEIALENAVEGCVNETFAAACGIWQHEHAEHEAFRAVMGRVAEEESGHAELSWGIHSWIMQQLTEAQQQHIRQAQRETVAALESSFKVENDVVLRQAVGLPGVEDAARLFQELRGQLWDARIA